MPELGLQILHPVVRPEDSALPDEPSTPEEIVEYAGNLIRAGLFVEAVALLSRREAQKIPQAFLFRAFAAVSQWDYAESREWLERYLALSAVSPYDRLVAEVNLADSLVSDEMLSSAKPLLDRLESETRAGGHRLLLANVLKYRARVAILEKDFAQGDRLLAALTDFMEEFALLDKIFLAKWKAINLGTRDPDEGQVALRKVLETAHAKKHWETIRDCHAWLAVLSRSEEALWECYFGTPHSAFRQRLLRNYGFRGKTPRSYVRNQRKGRVLDLSGEEELEGVRPGDARFRLLQNLNSDFFRPLRTGTLFQIVFPDECYNPMTSPNRVRTLLNRSRKLLKHFTRKETIKRTGDGFMFLPDFPVRMAIEGKARDRGEGLVGRIRAKFGRKQFTIREASKELGVAGRTVSRALFEAVTEGRIERKGAGPATSYRVKG